MRRRPGVTLIELLIVLAIIAVLATLIIAAAPRFGERHRASRGAGTLQSWLNLAKQRAMRDQRPVGIRLPVVTGSSANSDPAYQLASAYVREVLYVEQPDEGVGGTVTVPFALNYPPQTPPGNPTPYQCILLTTTSPFLPDNPQGPMVDVHPEALVRAGDTIRFPDRPMAHYASRRIARGGTIAPDGVKLPSRLTPQPSPPVPDNYVLNGVTYYNYFIQLDQPLPAMPFITTAHQFARKARPIVGEPVLQLPKDIAIDISREWDPAQPTARPRWFRMFPDTANTGGGNPFDIVFAPSGQVIGTEGILGSRICLWVRDVSNNTPSAFFGNDITISDPLQLPPGENTIIVVHTRTGHVTAHPIDHAGLQPNTGPVKTWNPFKFSQDALSSSQ